MQSRTRFIVIAALAAAIAAFVKRPVKPPQSDGAWHPTESDAARR